MLPRQHTSRHNLISQTANALYLQFRWLFRQVSALPPSFSNSDLLAFLPSTREIRRKHHNKTKHVNKPQPRAHPSLFACKTNLQDKPAKQTCKTSTTPPLATQPVWCAPIFSLPHPCFLQANDTERHHHHSSKPTHRRDATISPFVRRVNILNADDAAIGALQNDRHEEIIAAVAADDMLKRVTFSGNSQPVHAARK